MTTTRSASASTGGQWNLSGVLYQLLVTLRTSLRARVEAVAIGGDTAAVRVVVEPDRGGDTQTQQPGLRLVDQIKIRRGAAPWTTREIIEAVLPDLYAGALNDAGTSRFRFVTDRMDGTIAFSAFLEAVRDLAAKGPGAVDLDDRDKPYRWGNQRLTAAGLFAETARVLNRNADELRALLSSTEVVVLSQAGVASDADSLLEEMVDAREDVPIRRAALTARLMELGATGESLSVDALLRSVHLDPARLTIADRLPGLLAVDLREAVRRLQYAPDEDVRSEPQLPSDPFCLLSGDSGQGKTWWLCRLGLSLIARGRCAILLPAKGSLADIERRIVERLWLHSFDRSLPLSTLAERLTRKLADQDGVWLTVLLDDLADPMLADELAHTRWDGLGIRTVVTAQGRMTRKLTRLVEGLSEVAVPDFTLAELRAYLSRAGRDPARIPDDVLLPLTRPILAATYVRIPGSERWSAVSEYELMDCYWRWATTEQRDQALHASDADAVLSLAGALLDGKAVYPWPPRIAQQQGLTETSRDRLTMVGLLREAPDGALQAAHDRILNWAVAGEIARRLVEGEVTLEAVSGLLQGIDDLKTPRGEPIGRRLGYVLHDVFWKLANRANAQEVSDLILMTVRTGAASRDHERFFGVGLGSLGAAILPSLENLARQRFEGQESFFSRHIARALTAIADTAGPHVAAVAARLVRDDIESSRSIGIQVLTAVPAPDALDLLWTVNLERLAALETARASDQHWVARMTDQEQSFKALACAAPGAPGWVLAEALSVTQADAAGQLLWLLMRLDIRTARPIWKQAKDNLLSRLDPAARSIGRAVRFFQDREELWRSAGALGSKDLGPAVWFDTLVHLEPGAALAYLDQLKAGDLLGTSHWWLYRFARGANADAKARLADKLVADAGDPQLGLRAVAMLYAGESDALDAATFDRLLDGFEACLEREAAGEVEQRGVRGHLRRLIASAITPVLLNRLAARGGGRLETLVTQRAGQRLGRKSMYVDHTGDEYHQILAAIGGEGYDQLVMAELDRENVHGRTDGVVAAMWTDSPRVKARLEAIADQPDEDTYRQVRLMHTLAAHRSDAGQRRMVERGAPVFLEAVRIRDNGPGLAKGDVAHIEALLKSGDLEQRLKGMNLTGFIGAGTAGALLSPILEDPGASDEETSMARAIFIHLDHYDPAHLPVWKHQLTQGEDGAWVARFLADSGDPDARAAVAEWLARHPLTSLNMAIPPIALRLLDFEDSAAGGAAFLKRVRKSGLGWGFEGQILAALAENGDNEASVDLDRVAYQAAQRDSASAVAAIEALARTSRPEAVAAGQRLYLQGRHADAAELLMRLDPDAGTVFLIDDHGRGSVPVRWMIGRLLRRRAPRAQLLRTLSDMSHDPASHVRESAAEVAGWLPSGEPVDFLERLLDDEAEAVGKAALAAMRRRHADADCAELLASILDQPRARRWAWLRALIHRGEPANLADPEDPLSIHPLLEALGDDFRNEASDLLQKRRKAIEQEADKLEKERRK